jgi:hypothetical protein
MGLLARRSQRRDCYRAWFEMYNVIAILNPRLGTYHLFCPPCPRMFVKATPFTPVPSSQHHQHAIQSISRVLLFNYPQQKAPDKTTRMPPTPLLPPTLPTQHHPSIPSSPTSSKDGSAGTINIIIPHRPKRQSCARLCLGKTPNGNKTFRYAVFVIEEGREKKTPSRSPPNVECPNSMFEK